MYRIFIIMNKIIHFFGKTNIIAKIMRKVYNQPFDKISFNTTCVVVIGDKGRGIVTDVIRSVCDETKILCYQNKTIEECLSQLLLNTSMKGVMNKEFVVLEFDDIVSDNFMFPIDYLVITSMEDNYDRKKDILSNNMRDDICLVINKDDVILANIKSNNYFLYEFDFRKKSFDRDLIIPVVCPGCGSILEYTNHFYGYVGKYSCKCGYHKKYKSDLVMRQVDIDAKTFRIDNIFFKVRLDDLYMYSSLLAGISVLIKCGYSLIDIAYKLEDFESDLGFKEMFYFNDLSGIAFYVQDGYDLTKHLESISKDKSDKVFVFDFDENISFLYDANITSYTEGIDKIICVGKSALDMKIRLLYAKIRYDKVTVLKDIKEALIFLNMVKNNIYIFSNRTKMKQLFIELNKYPENRGIGDVYV